MTSSTSLTISGSSAEVGSSNSMSDGCMASARAMATRCCCPPERKSGNASALSVSPTRSSRLRAISCASAVLLRRIFLGPSQMFCAAVRCGNRLNDWNTMPIWRRSSRNPDFVVGTCSPRKRMLPPSGVSRPLMQRSSVLLPEPLAPQTVTTSPAPMVRLTDFSTSSVPKLLPSPLISRSGADAPVILAGPAAAPLFPRGGLAAARRD
jgi:hypothetical protein